MDFLEAIIHPGFWKYRYIVPGILLAALCLLIVFRRRDAPRAQAAVAVLLVVSALLGAFYFNLGNILRWDYFNSYEFYHYYIGTKYHEEVGYSDMYLATAGALQESTRYTPPASVRDLDAEAPIPIFRAEDRIAAVKAGFTPGRWAEFRKDVEYFRSDFRNDDLWNRMLLDKGYNAPPMWTMISGTLANCVSTDSDWGMQFLAFLDLVAMAIAFAAIGWAFGHRAMFFAIAFLGVHFVSTSPTLHAAFLRYDWIACMIVSVCLIKRGYYGWAGALTAYAACMRIFPAVFVFGIGGRLIWDLLDKRRLNPDAARFLAIFAATAVALVVASVFYTGIGYWSAFIEKMAMHNDDMSPRRAGFKYFFLMDYGTTPFWHGGKRQILEQYQWHIRGIAVLALVVALLGIRRLQDYEAYLLGIVPFFFLTAATYYYFVILILPFLFFVVKADRIPHALGVVFMLVSGAALHAVREVFDRSYELFFWLSASVLVTVVYMILLALPAALRGERAWDAGLNEKPQA